MILKGEELQKKIRGTGISAKEIYKKAGIPENTFFSLYKKDEVEDHYIQAIANVDQRLYKTLIENENPSTMIETAMRALSKAVDALSEDNKHLRNENAYANEIIRDWLKLNNQKAKSA